MTTKLSETASEIPDVEEEDTEKTEEADALTKEVNALYETQDDWPVIKPVSLTLPEEAGEKDPPKKKKSGAKKRRTKITLTPPEGIEELSDLSVRKKKEGT